ncbi:hypothetical protein KKF32_04275, partial [Patescibacteria group bacterium]|nr:hypothetical protein [Patescibacteria group bacterium]
MKTFKTLLVVWCFLAVCSAQALAQNYRFTKVIDDPYINYDVKNYDGKVVWCSYSGTGNNSEIWLYDGKEAKQITNNSVSDIKPDIYNNQIVWLREGSSYGVWDVYSYKNGSEEKLTYYNASDDFVRYDSGYASGGPKVCNGMVVFPAAAKIGDTDSAWISMVKYQNGVISKISSPSTTPGINDYPDIQNNIIAWSQMYYPQVSGPYGWQLVIYNGTENVIPGFFQSSFIPQVDNGQVVWSGSSISTGNNDTE